MSGGTFPLTADLSFGTNFGIFAKYFTSVSANPAGVGVVRLANTDAVEWRNAANNANLPLSVDSSNNLLWNGDIISTSSSSPVLSITGTANQIIASAATGNISAFNASKYKCSRDAYVCLRDTLRNDKSDRFRNDPHGHDFIYYAVGVAYLYDS